MTTVAQALANARAAGVDRLDAQWLLGHLLQCDSAWLMAHDGDRLTTLVAVRYADMIARRAQGEPLAYLVGQAGFHGLTLQVTPDVLVPRPDTETLVDWALELLPTLGTAPQVLDLGTGSGAVALAVKHRHPTADVTATDFCPAALAVAQHNARALGLSVCWARGNWWKALKGGSRFDLVLSNPPYIAAGDPHLPALHHEPMLALSPGGDGLDALRTIVAGAPVHVAPGGWLLLEHGWDQAPAVAALLADAGFETIGHRHDLGGHPRCTGGRRRAPDKG